MSRRLVIPVVAIAALAAVVTMYAPARLFMLVLVGRSPVCPMGQALESAENLRRQIEIKDRILSGSKRIAVDDAGYELWATPRSRYWLPKGSQYTLPYNLAEQERDIYSRGDVHVKVGDVVLDCGANVGVYTRKALYEGARLVVAIEPAPENLECLRRNFEREIALGKVVLYPKGVWDKDDVLNLYINPTNSAADSFVIEQAGGTKEVQVPLTTIDEMVGQLGLDRVDFIKMDIEGAEVKALRGAKETLARFHPRLAISSYHSPEHPVEVPRAVKAAWDGYTMECGPCAEADWRVRPDVLLFH